MLDPENPWPGLDAFVEPDASFFYGRDEEVKELVRLVKREPLTVFFGRSGLGKTSLLRAGLFPMLRANGLIPVFVRLNLSADAPRLADQVLESLGHEAVRGVVETPPVSGAASLWEYFHSIHSEFWSSQNELLVPVLVFDQLEEVFSLGLRSARLQARTREFLSELGDLIENRPPEHLRAAASQEPEIVRRFNFRTLPCRVILAFREDFLADFDELRRVIPSVQSPNRLRLLPMKPMQAIHAVAAAGGRLVNQDVAARIVDVAAGVSHAERAEAEIEPLFLSLICHQLNLSRRERGLPQISEDLVADAGGDILSRFYEQSVGDLDSRVRAFLEENLITAAGYRNSFALDDALRFPGMDRDVLVRLVERRVIRMDQRLGVGRVELTHDVLAAVVKTSRDHRRAEVLFERQRQEADWSERERREAQRTSRLRRLRVSILILILVAVAVGAWIAIR